MESRKRAKLNKILIITAIVLAILAVISIIVYVVLRNQEEESYEDTVTAKRYFVELTVDFSNQEVKRDGEKTTLMDEFDITETQQTLMIYSQEDLKNFFLDSTFEVEIKDNIAYITNEYQTKKLIVEVSELKGTFKDDNIESIEQIQDNIYILTFDTQKRTKDAYEYLSTLDWITNIEIDKVSIIDTISDESQTVYGETQEETEETEYKAHGVSAMGLDNYQNIISENGNPSDITIATIGYGACIDNSYFTGRISDNYYNFIEDSNNVYETIPQGSRMLEVITESTTHNVKIMPLMVIDSENYTTTVSIVKAIDYAIQNSDVIFYEFVNEEDYIINLMLKNAFKEDVPVCSVTTSSVDEEENYPANNSTTIAVSSITKSGALASYSGTGDYIDFSAYSTDIEEIFNSNSSVSKWSGASYSCAEIVSAIALIKTYNKDYTILEVYNELRNYCIDLGEGGKDEKFGYGCPDFSDLKISDIDKTSPEILEVIYNNEDWELEKTIQIKAQDNIRIYGWAITTSEETPTEWNEFEVLTAEMDVTGTVTENGTYYIWVTDSAGNISNTSINVEKVDNTAPTIQYAIDTTTQDSENYVTISVTATDELSGLNEAPYSWDNENWGTDSNELKVTENGRYKIYVRDALENVAEQEIVVDTFDQEGVATIEEGEIIKSIVVSSSWNGNTNEEVRITFNNNFQIVQWAITESSTVPENFNNVETSSSDTSTNEDTNTDNTNTNNTSTNNTTSDNTTTNNTTNTTTTNTTNETSNTLNATEYEDSTSSNEYVTIVVSLNADTQYYAWIKDDQGNIVSQAFSVSKVEI